MSPNSDQNDPVRDYPRVLLLLASKVMADDPANLLIRTQFGDWPKDRLAQIHSGETGGTGEFCGHYYRLGPKDRVFGGLFKRLRNPVFDSTMALEQVSRASTLLSRRQKLWTALKRGIGQLLVHSGVWEVVFRVRVSREMEQFIERFAPDVIYCQGYTLGFAVLPLMIGRRFGIPIVFQTTDDWPSYTYRWSPVGILLRCIARKLICAASLRMAFGEKMRREYECRYGVDFLTSYHADDLGRFPARSSSLGPGQPLHIVATGSLALKRYEGLVDLLRALETLGETIPPTRILVYCPGVPKDVPESIRSAPTIQFLPSPSHERLPMVLAEADLLFLAESFEVEPGAISLSVSTKCHLYMFSRTPILVYGPTYAGTIEYAHREGWGVVVRERSVPQLADSLRCALMDERTRQRLAERATATVRRFHDRVTVREAIRTHFLQLTRGRICARDTSRASRVVVVHRS